MSARELDPRDDWFAEPVMVDDLIDQVRDRVIARRTGVMDVLVVIGVAGSVLLVIALAWLAVFAAVAVAKWALVAVWPVPAAFTAMCALLGGRP